MTKQEILNIPYDIDGDTYTVGEMMGELHRSSTPMQAHYWHRWLVLALKPLVNILSVIREEMDAELEAKGPLATSVAAVKGQLGIAPQQLAPNKIFKSSQGAYNINMVYLWQWINDTLVGRMQYSYGWLALLLFAKHHKLLLKDDTKSFSEQMRAWFPNVSHLCTPDQVNVYRRGFFREEKYHFDYGKWIHWEDPLPTTYEYLKDQHPEGFKHIHGLCIALEEADYPSQIFIKNTNK